MLAESYSHLLSQGILETAAMVMLSSTIGVFFGLMLGVILFITQKNQITASPTFHLVLGLVINIARSVPFIIFLIAIVPLTKLLIGSTIGLGAAIVPLTLAAIPFYARIAESALMQVSTGLIDAALSMGATTLQLILKVLIPEALPALIQGATLTVISLIGYSAMAGAVGGGGLGELAIEYGYQRFETGMMIATVSILVLFVQFIQVLGDRLAKTRRLGAFTLVFLITLSIIFYLLHISASNTTLNTLRIGITGGPQEKIMAVAKKIAKDQYGLDLKLIVFSDYILPNQALASGDLDANIFQHIPYLNAQKKIHHYPIDWVAKTFVYPMGFYSKTLQHLNQLPQHALIALPNDPSNEGRALLLLQHCHLIRLRPSAGLLATPLDVIENRKQLRFKTLDAAQIPRVLNSVSLAGITNDYLSIAGFNATEALCKEDKNSPYANVIAIKTGEENNPALKTLVEVMHSEAVRKATYAQFPDGIPAFKVKTD